MIKIKVLDHERGHSFPTAQASQRFLNKLLFGPLAHTKDMTGAPQCQSCPTKTQSAPKQRKKTCLPSFIKCLIFSLSFLTCVCVHMQVCARQLCNLFSLEADQVKDTCRLGNWQCESRKKASRPAGLKCLIEEIPVLVTDY